MPHHVVGWALVTILLHRHHLTPYSRKEFYSWVITWQCTKIFWYLWQKHYSKVKSQQIYSRFLKGHSLPFPRHSSVIFFCIFMVFFPDTSFLFSIPYVHQNLVAEILSVGIRAGKEGCHWVGNSLPENKRSTQPSSRNLWFSSCWIWSDHLWQPEPKSEEARSSSPILKQAQTFHLSSLWPWWIFKPFLFESTGTFP